MNLLEKNRDEVMEKRNAKPTSQKLVTLSVDKVKPNPYQPRMFYDPEALAELSQSIIEMGLLQPISVRKTGFDSYELIAGERRLRATKMAGLTTIQAIIVSSEGRDSALFALIENLQRRDLHFFEEAESYQRLLNSYGMTQEELASTLSKNQSTIANKLRVARLPAAVKEAIMQAELTERHARALLRLHDADAQLSIVQEIVEKQCNVKQTEELVDNTLQSVLNPQSKGRGARKGMVRLFQDYRLVINTVQTAVAQIRSTGIKAKLSTLDAGDHLEIRVTIPKKE